MKRVIRALLRLPLPAKLVIANMLIAGVAAWLAAWGAGAYVRAEPGNGLPPVWALLGATLVLAMLVANVVIVRLALSPLDDLARTARTVTTEGPPVRAPVSPLADPQVEALVESFNTMLARTERYRERLRRLAARCRTGREEERRKIARELRDDAAQRLSVALLQLGIVQRRAAEGATAEGLEIVQSHLTEVADRLRCTVHELRIADLDGLGLPLAIEAQAREIRERSGIHVTVDRAGWRDEMRLSSHAEIAAYWIVREALANVERHSGAGRAKVTLDEDEEALRIVVADDGRGFDPDGAIAREGAALGLFEMEEWAVSADGRLLLDSGPGRGTRVTLVLPRPGAGGA